MTTVGHSLTGLSIAVLALPRGRSFFWYFVVGHFFIFFANVPDFPLPGWGHESYEVSHSVFVTIALALCLATLRWIPAFNAQVGGRILIFWTIAWLSHMMLDALYNHGQGIGIFWPVSDAHLALPVSWFETLTWPPDSEHYRRVFGIEFAVYGSILAVCVLLRRWIHAAE